MRRGVVVLAALGLSVAACGGTSGTPAPQTTNPAAGTSTAAATSSAPSAPASTSAVTLATIDDPCSLIASAQAAKLGITGEGTPKQTGTAESCEWRATGDVLLAVDVRTNDAGLAQVQANGGTMGAPFTLGDHRARKQHDSVACLFALGVSPSSRVDVTGMHGGGPDCAAAKAAAVAVETNLPAQVTRTEDSQAISRRGSFLPPAAAAAGRADGGSAFT